MSEARDAVREAAQAHEGELWGLCYRMTGSAADADDLVQETFARALERPPPDLTRPLRPWLATVAVRLATDQLRRRQEAGYVGPWLPSPIETSEEEAALASVEADLGGGASTEHRYDLLESVSLAFLVALEALTPKQRAVLLLRDVFDYSGQEVARALDVTEADVRTTHHRARKAMEGYDRERCLPTRANQQRTREALEQFVTLLSKSDVPGLESMLAGSVRALSDGGGEFHAARVPLIGPERVAKFLIKVAALRGMPDSMEVRFVNGLPALVVDYAPERCGPGEAPRVVNALQLGPEGKVVSLLSVLATPKLAALRTRPARPA